MIKNVLFYYQQVKAQLLLNFHIEYIHSSVRSRSQNQNMKLTGFRPSVL